ncbi:MAG: chlorophyllide reductase subunit Y, partial [Pseudomonadota bacterium]
MTEDLPKDFGGPIRYDDSDDTFVIEAEPEPHPETDAPINFSAEGVSCVSGDMRAQAEANGSAEILARYAEDYPQGPHDQPQSMCPAFGSLRVGLRMRRTATILSGSACCVYGLTFVSHFY